MRVLLTGATGFVGRRLGAALLEAGHDVKALVRPSSTPFEGAWAPALQVVEGDVTVRASLDEAVAEVDAVVHLAGVTEASRASTYHRVNTNGTVNLADAASMQPDIKHFIFISSLSAQGPSPVGLPHLRCEAEQPLNDYGRSKLAAEHTLRSRYPNLPITVLRPSIIYGPGDLQMLNWAKLVSRRLIPTVTDLELSFLHVDDFSDLIVALLKRAAPEFGPFFLSDGVPRKMGAVVDMLEQIIRPEPAFRVPISGLIDLMAPAIERFAALTGLARMTARTIRELAASGWTCQPDEARRAFGFEPKISLHEGLPRTFDWYRNADWI